MFRTHTHTFPCVLRVCAPLPRLSPARKPTRRTSSCRHTSESAEEPRRRFYAFIATVATSTYLDGHTIRGQLHINGGNTQRGDPRTTRQKQNSLVSSLLLLYRPLLLLFAPIHHPPRLSSEEEGAFEWGGGGRSRLLSGYKTPRRLLFAFEVELLHNWAPRVCRLRRLLHLKFGRDVAPAETRTKPPGSAERCED